MMHDRRDPVSLLQFSKNERLSLGRENAPETRPENTRLLQEAMGDSSADRVPRKLEESPARGSNGGNQEARSLFQSLAQAREDLYGSLAEFDRLRLGAESTEVEGQDVTVPGQGPGRSLDQSESLPAHHKDRLSGEEDSGRENDAIVRGLMTLRDELDRLRRELQDAQSELKTARDSDARIKDLERLLGHSRQECEAIRAALRQSDQELEGQSRRAANLVQEQAASSEHSKGVMKQIETLSPDRRQAIGELSPEDDLRLQSLTDQLEECRSANRRLRSLLRVFGLVSDLG